MVDAHWIPVRPGAARGWFEGELPPSARRSPEAAEAGELAPGLASDPGWIVEVPRSLDTPVILLAYRCEGSVP